MDRLSAPPLRMESRPDTVTGAPARRHRRRGLRLRRHDVETVVRVFEEPERGRRLTLIATMHVGDASYYDALSALLADLAAAGAAVHYERIRRADDADLTDEERDRLDSVTASGYPAGLAAFVGALGLELQGECLALPAGARNVDVTDVEVLRALGWDRYRRLVEPPAVRIDEGAAPLARPAFRFLLRHGRTIDRLRALSAGNRHATRFLIGARNRVALAEALQESDRHDVVLVWGAAHVPGLARELRRRGYRLRTERWLRVCAL